MVMYKRFGQLHLSDHERKKRMKKYSNRQLKLAEKKRDKDKGTTMIHSTQERFNDGAGSSRFYFNIDGVIRCYTRIYIN
jgi:hypothetical protein